MGRGAGPDTAIRATAAAVLLALCAAPAVASPPTAAPIMPIAPSPYLTDWGVTDMRTAIAGARSTVIRADVDADGGPYIAAKSPSGVRFTVTGRLCDFAPGARSGPKRCRGAILQTRFSLASDAAVDAAVKKWGKDYAAVSISNVGDNNVLVMRYVIFDHGLHRDNLKVNVSVFTGVAEEIWAGI